MRLSLAVEACRDKIHDADRKFWTDAEITRWITYHMRNLFRRKVNADRSYGFHVFTIQSTDVSRIRARYTNCQAYYLPTWVYGLHAVRTVESGGGRGNLISVITVESDRYDGWKVSGNRTLDLVGYGTPISIEIECAKLPPPMHQGITPLGSDPGKLVLASAPVDQDSNPYQLSHEIDAYVGMEFEITTAPTDARNPRDQVAEAFEQESFYDAGQSDQVQRVTLMPEFSVSPIATDTYEMHVPIDEAHTEYLAVLVANSLFQKTKNLDGMAAVTRSLPALEKAFIDSLRPRQTQQPFFMMGDNSGGYFNPDKDWSGESF